MRLVRLAVPSAVPNVMIALRITAGQRIVAAMVAEFLMGTSGLGHLFAVTHADFHMERAIGASVVAIVLSTLIYVSTAAAERWARTRMAD
jgi:ABC-type nitrate/sulfonate/bicarbonate transport system permease component